jgi:hypothetical protein
MKSATLFCVVRALSGNGAGCVIIRRIVLPSVRAGGESPQHGARLAYFLLCFAYIDSRITFYGFS